MPLKLSEIYKAMIYKDNLKKKMADKKYYVNFLCIMCETMSQWWSGGRPGLACVAGWPSALDRVNLGELALSLATILVLIRLAGEQNLLSMAVWGVEIKRGIEVGYMRTRDGEDALLTNNNMAHYSIISNFHNTRKALSFFNDRRQHEKM